VVKFDIPHRVRAVYGRQLGIVGSNGVHCGGHISSERAVRASRTLSRIDPCRAATAAGRCGTGRQGLKLARLRWLFVSWGTTRRSVVATAAPARWEVTRWLILGIRSNWTLEQRLNARRLQPGPRMSWLPALWKRLLPEGRLLPHFTTPIAPKFTWRGYRLVKRVDAFAGTCIVRGPAVET
jgi:hypothetical protein